MPAKQRKDGNYEISATIGEKRKHFYGKTALEAEEKMWRAVIAYKDNRLEESNSSLTFKAIREEWYMTKRNFNLPGSATAQWNVSRPWVRCLPQIRFFSSEYSRR